MIFAKLSDGRKDLPKQFVLMNDEEGKLLIEALEEFCKNNPRRKKAKKLLAEFGELPCY